MNYIERIGLLTAGENFCYSAKVFSPVNAKIKVMQGILKRVGRQGMPPQNMPF